MRTLVLLVFCTALFGASITSQAELMIGGYPPGVGNFHPLRQFAATAQGTDAPLRVLGGPISGLDSPGNASYEETEKLLYVSDYFGQAIRVFPAFASGDTAPLRIINPPVLGQPRANVPIASRTSSSSSRATAVSIPFASCKRQRGQPDSQHQLGRRHFRLTELNNPSS